MNQSSSLLADLGASIALCGLLVYLVSGAAGLGSVAVSITFLLTAASVLWLPIGFCVRLMVRRGPVRNLFSLTFPAFGAIIAALASAASIVLDLIFGYEAGLSLAAQVLMCGGSLLASVFLMILLIRQHKANPKT